MDRRAEKGGHTLTTPSDPVPKELRSALETVYSAVPRDEVERIIDDLISITEYGTDKKHSIDQILDHAVKLIFKRLAFSEILVGLLDRKDGKYRYVLEHGFRKEVEAAYKKMEYDHEDMVSPERFPYIRTGKLSEFNPVEGLPPGEKILFNRPYSLGVGRRSFTEFHEGDYFDIWMMDGNNNIIGWFELTSPRGGQMPSRSSLRWIELIASLCGSIVLERWSEESLESRR